ncbi:MAG TPA: hypothetical protein VIV66_00755 [Pyrinomonadaceae bacterium]
MNIAFPTLDRGQSQLEMVQQWKTVTLVRRRPFRMAVVVEMHHTGNQEQQRDVVAIVEHVLSDHLGNWRVVVVGSQDSAQWELKILGPNGFERSYTLEGNAGQHDPHANAAIVSRMVPRKS